MSCQLYNYWYFRLSGGSRWIPLRFHCVDCLHILAGIQRLRNAEETPEGAGDSTPTTPAVLVPSMPLLLDVFRLFDFNKRATVASKVPMDLRPMLYFSPSQRRETACQDAVASWLLDLLSEALVLYAASPAFPEYSKPASIEVSC